MNGGSCIDGVDNFTCSCPPNFTGALCECLILDENNYDCEYVSPTAIYKTTSTAFFTTLTEKQTTDIAPTTTLTIYDSKTSKDVTSTTKFYSSTLPTTEYMSTTELTLPMTSGDRITKSETITSIITTNFEETTAPTAKHDDTTTTKPEDITVTTITDVMTIQPQTPATISSHDSKTESTSTCKETCNEVTEATTQTSSLGDLQTTLWSNYTTLVDFSSYPTKITSSVNNKTELDTTTLTSTQTTTRIAEETTITEKIDTTEKMFTDVPTELASTDTTTIYTTTEAFETTTLIDKTTHTYTTIQSECTDSICHNHGSCANTIHGIRVSTDSYGLRYTFFNLMLNKIKALLNRFVLFQVSLLVQLWRKVL